MIDLDKFSMGEERSMWFFLRAMPNKLWNSSMVIFPVYISINVNQVSVTLFVAIETIQKRFIFQWTLRSLLTFFDAFGTFFVSFQFVIVDEHWQMAEKLTNKHCHFDEKHIVNLRFEHIHYAHAHHNCFHSNQGVYYLTSFIPIYICHSIDVCFVLMVFLCGILFILKRTNEWKKIDEKNRNRVHTCKAHTSNFKMWNCGRRRSYIYCIDNETSSIHVIFIHSFIDYHLNSNSNLTT